MRDRLEDTEALSAAVEDWSQVQVERELMRLSREAQQTRVKLRRAALRAGRAKARYKATAARVALTFRAEDIENNVPSRGTGSVTEHTREARVNAHEEVKDAAFNHYVSEQVMDATVESARLIRAEMSALQSVLADLRPMVAA